MLRWSSLDAGQPTQFVGDGSTALLAAVTRVWGQNAVIQRCQVRKTRNLKAHVSEKHWPELPRRVSDQPATPIGAAPCSVPEL